MDGLSRVTLAWDFGRWIPVQPVRRGQTHTLVAAPPRPRLRPFLENLLAMARSLQWQERSDAELLAACRDGDGHAWRALIQRYRRLVYGVARGFELQPADADEVFQTTFVELLRWLPRLRDPQRLEPWLVTTVRRASLRVLRQQRRRHVVPEQAADEEVFVEAADVAIERLRDAEHARRALESIGDPCRTLLLGLFAAPARSYRALAAELGVKIGSLGALRARCLGRLRARLQSLRVPRPAAAGGGGT